MYGIGESIEVDVTFNHPVRVVGEPALTLNIRNGGAPPQDYTVRSRPLRGQQTVPIPSSFSYLVQAGDNDNNGFIVSEIGDTGLGEGTIKSADSSIWDLDALHGFDCSTSPHVQRSIPGQRIATGRAVVTDVEIASSPADGRAYRLGESIEIDVTFNGKVKAVDKPTLGLLVRGHGCPGRRRDGLFAGGRLCLRQRHGDDTLLLYRPALRPGRRRHRHPDQRPQVGVRQTSVGAPALGREPGQPERPSHGRPPVGGARRGRAPLRYGC